MEVDRRDFLQVAVTGMFVVATPGLFSEASLLGRLGPCLAAGLFSLDHG